MIIKDEEIFYAILDIKLIFSKYDLSDNLYINRLSGKESNLFYYYKNVDTSSISYLLHINKKIDSLRKTYIDKNIKIIHISPDFHPNTLFTDEYTVDEYIERYFKKEKRLHNLDKFI